MEKYNGAPIDGGSSKLKLELIIDPTKKPLATRILANAGKIPTQPKASKAKPAKADAKKAAPAKKQGNKTKSKRPAKKTIEQLDQEMSDYFEKKD